jgi:hypothetical protein
MKKWVFLFLLIPGFACAQITKSALFLGNSYTGVNNLPNLVWNMAENTGDSLIYDSNTPGGHTLQGHSANAISLGKIASGGWDYVVLQEQSQLPSFPDGQVQSDVYPYAARLNDSILKYNPCAETVFYMTWGRKNGDASNCASWPPVCTYTGMDSLLRLRYETMAANNDAILSPVGAAWRYVRINHPGIELYQADESHPSVAGSYLAALSFYTVLYRKDPTLISWNHTLPAADAAILRDAAKAVVYDILSHWHVGEYDPVADFGYVQTSGYAFDFINQSANADSVAWNFGGGFVSLLDTTLVFAGPGTYTVTLVAYGCGLTDTLTQAIVVSPFSGVGVMNATMEVYPNPSQGFLRISGLHENDYALFNAFGQRVRNGRASHEELFLDLSDLPDGTYLLVSAGRTIRFVLQR